MNYFDTMEDKDTAKLTEFNHNIKLLEKFGEMRRGEVIDITGVTSNHNEAVIELKSRSLKLVKNGFGDYAELVIAGKRKDGTVYTGNTMMIEEHKYADLQYFMCNEGKTGLYINFLDDAVVLYDLSKLSSRPKRSNEIMRIWSEGKQAYEYEYRRFLDLKDAWIWEMSDNGKYKLIQKGAKK